MKYTLNKQQQQAMDMIHERFLDEHMRGFTDRKSVKHEPVSKEDAEAKWNAVQHKLVWQMFDLEVIQKLRLDKDEPIAPEAIAEAADRKARSRAGDTTWAD
jgi:hypothetical protein